MTTSLSYLAVQAHLHDLHRDSRRHRGYEARVRQMVRRAPPRQVTHRTHHVPVARHH
jgi:primosomal protein N''